MPIPVNNLIKTSEGEIQNFIIQQPSANSSEHLWYSLFDLELRKLRFKYFLRGSK